MAIYLTDGGSSGGAGAGAAATGQQLIVEGEGDEIKSIYVIPQCVRRLYEGVVQSDYKYSQSRYSITRLRHRV